MAVPGEMKQKGTPGQVSLPTRITGQARYEGSDIGHRPAGMLEHWTGWHVWVWLTENANETFSVTSFLDLYYVRCTKWIYGRNLTSDDINTIWFIDCTSQNDSQESVCMIKPNCQQLKFLLLYRLRVTASISIFLCLILISSLFVAIKNNVR